MLSRRSPRLLFTIAVLLGFTPAAQAHAGTDVAIADLTDLIALAPNRAELFLRRAACFVEHQRWAEALDDLDRAARLAPEHADLPLARAEFFLARRDSGAAIQALEKSILANPQAPAGRIVRARARVLAHDPVGALTDFQVALALLPAPRPELWLEANLIMAQPEAALRDIDRGIARLGPVPALVDRALALEVQLGRIDAAASRLAHIASSAERPDLFHKRRGDLLAAAGRAEEGRAAYRDALAAIARLPDWLRSSGATQQVTAHLTSLTTPTS